MPGGRPSSMTAERARDAIKHRRRGMPISLCAQAVGVSERSLYRWLKKGEQPKAPRRFRAFRQSFMSAWAQRASDCLAAIVGEYDDDEDEGDWNEEEQGPKRSRSPLRNSDWKPLAWWLQRTGPQSFGELRSDGASKPRAEADLADEEEMDGDSRAALVQELAGLPLALLDEARALAKG